MTNNDAGGPAADGSAPSSDPCPGGKTTAITGTTYAPNGKLPLYNVMVYVPSTPLPAFTQGVTCDRCAGATVRAVASAISDERGQFRITNVPAGKDVPLVFQVGKWRRKVTLPNVVACQDNPITDANLSRLPRNRQEGDLPRIAVATGECDSLGCLLLQVGVDRAEIGIAGQDRAVTNFMGGTFRFGPIDTLPGATSASQLWTSEAELSKYDLALLSCECDEFTASKGPIAYEAMSRYLAKGGRIFSSDRMYVWYRHTAGLTGALTIGGDSPPDGTSPLHIDTSFPKGKAMADWMKFLDPAGTYGEISSREVYDNLTAAMAPTARVWASSVTLGDSVPRPRIVSVNTPAGAPADQQCGRATHLDAHIGPSVPLNLPPGYRIDLEKFCGTELSKSEQALAFLFFDLTACIQDDTRPVVPPIVIP